MLSIEIEIRTVVSFLSLVIYTLLLLGECRLSSGSDVNVPLVLFIFTNYY